MKGHPMAKRRKNPITETIKTVNTVMVALVAIPFAVLDAVSN